MDNTSNPWVILAADVAATAVTVWPTKAIIEHIEFVGFAANTDSCTINQLNGKLLAQLHAPLTGDLEDVRTGKIGHTDGIVIPITGITAGKVLIYHK